MISKKIVIYRFLCIWWVLNTSTTLWRDRVRERSGLSGVWEPRG